VSAAEGNLKFKLAIAYDGSRYAGWQIQKIGLGVQQVIEEALAKIFSREIRLHSSSRTDQGVHARAMIAHFEIPEAAFKMSLPKLPLAINANLPPDIRVMEARRAKPKFHARFDAKGKEYRYLVYNHHAHDPLLRLTSWHVPGPLNLAAMKAAARAFVGKQDFEAFAATRGYKMESYVRTLSECSIQKKGPLLAFKIRGDGFLYKMCRGIVGTLVQVGMGKFKADDVRPMLAARDRRMAGMTAPAHGLVLWKVFY
jgi:tRNA pseudouridine38-40 synthase